MPGRLPFTLSIIILLAASGCQIRQGDSVSSRQPIVSGKVVSVTIWEKPVQRPGELGENSGSSPAEGSRVDVYDQFIIVTTPNGEKLLSPHGWYTNLRFKAL